MTKKLKPDGGYGAVIHGYGEHYTENRDPQSSKQRFLRDAAAFLREVGKHPKSGATINLLAGRYGPYVTDGTTNASVPKGTAPEQVTVEQAVELLAAREGAPKKGRAVKRAAGPKKSGRRKTVGAAS